MKQIFPLRLKLARHRVGLSMQALIDRMGDAAVSKMTISKFERGLLMPSPRTLQAIADVCNVPVSFFFIEPDVSLVPMCFRYEKDMPSRKAKKIEAEVTMKIEECFVKEQMVNMPARFVNPLQYCHVCTYADAEEAAQKLRQYMLVGTHPLHSVYEMLQELGVMVIEIDVDSNELLGTSTIINKLQPVVIVNSRSCTTTERKRFTALHELAHLLLAIEPVSEEEFRKDSTMSHLKPPTVERLCHWFANALLICASSLKRRLGDNRTNLSIEELISVRNMYGISIAATVHRAHDLGIILDDTYNHLYDDYINKNRMEDGWGSYPVMEKADRYELLDERILMESDFDKAVKGLLDNDNK